MSNLYLAGPMTGIEDHNYPAFDAAARDLRAQGFDVINPTEGFDGDQTLGREVYLRRAIENLLVAEAIVVLPDWTRSSGAIFELGVARALDLPMYRYEPQRPPAALFG